MSAITTTQRGTVLDEKQTYLADYKALSTNGAAGPEWLRALRADAIAAFRELRFPTTKDEDWKYTSVAPIVQVPFLTAHAPSDDVARARVSRVGPVGATELVFLNGQYAQYLSTLATDGIWVAPLSALPDAASLVAETQFGRYALADRVAFTALNTALLADVAVVHVAVGKSSPTPIFLTFASDSDDDVTASHPRVLIVLDRDAQATVVESYVGSDDRRYLTNAVTEIVLGEGARLEHVKLVQESQRAFHVGTTQVHQERDSNLSSVSVAMGGALVRNDLNVMLDAEGASCSLYGLYAVDGAQHVDNHTLIEHVKPHGTSRQVYKGVLDGRARAVFNGKVIVRKDAQQTDAQQTNRNLLLSGDATIDTKPQLEIFADDVKCTHGAAVGQLDPDALFYLRSRGMSEEIARSLLTYGFAREVLERISVASVREQLDEQLRSSLRRGW